MQGAETTQYKYLSDFISYKDIDTWINKLVYIKAGTGAGKTTFVLKKLHSYAKHNNQKILLLNSRRVLKEQTRKKVQKGRKQETITVKTYQRLKDLSERGTLKDFLNSFDFIVCDEFQFFVDDTGFNRFTDISFDAILDSGKTVIFISATGDKMADYITDFAHKELVKINFEGENLKSYPRLWYYDNELGLDQIINYSIAYKEKLLVFVNDTRKGAELYKRHKEYCAFYCSETNYRNHEYMDLVEESRTEYTNVLTKEKFDCLVFIVTKSFDVGVNIKDPELCNIVLDGFTDIDDIIQCVGRKRAIENSVNEIYLYVRNIENKTLRAYMAKEKRNINLVDTYVNEGRAAYLKKLQKQRRTDPPGFMYEVPEDDVKHIIWLRYYKAKCTWSNLRQMCAIKDDGYLQVIKSTFGCQSIEYWDTDDDNDLYSYLESRVFTDNAKSKKENNDKWLLDDEAKTELLNILNTGRKHEIIESLKLDLINAYIRDKKHYPFEIVQRETSRRVDGKKQSYKTAWKIIKKPFDDVGDSAEGGD